ncbi:MAG: hypothetical protein AOA65_1196 [Candidatus Bathyarchaeota archaeon BA1]|nr:MAG: hypothetical protein AOA65_1196 [Candidatus Bathyarchaeota archaeon BA1]
MGGLGFVAFAFSINSAFGDVILKIRRKCFMKQRSIIARKLQNPRISRITWCSIDHWKGTMEYHKTKDILHVMKVLCHKNIKKLPGLHRRRPCNIPKRQRRVPC